MTANLDIFIEAEMTDDEKYMSRCLHLASKGEYGAFPNPMVGAVIVHKGRIIGEGYHVRCGGPHAEVNAIHSVADKSLLPYSTIYVSLEPCSHYGKTPPCADLIIEKKIPRVVVGCIDPFSQVSGRGIEKMRAAGIDVTVGVLEQECLSLNRKFIVLHQKKRPYITLKWAQSADGFIDANRADSSADSPIAFSTPVSQAWMHKCRSLHQAIMIGTNTALLDNPSLLNRCWAGASPVRVVWDRKGRLPKDLKIFTDGHPTLVYVYESATPSYEDASAVTTVRMKEDDSLSRVLDDLYARSISSLLVEGGSALLRSFISEGLWDEMRVEVADILLQDGVPAPSMPSEEPCASQILDGNRILTWFND